MSLKQFTIWINLVLLSLLVTVQAQNPDPHDRNGSAITGMKIKSEEHNIGTVEEQLKEYIHDKTNLFTEAHITKNIDLLNSCFTDDAKIFPPNSEAVIGQSAISKLNTNWVNYGIHEFTQSSISMYGTGDYIIDEGTYNLRYGDKNTVDKGKYINIWTKEGDVWRICNRIWNTSLAKTINTN